MAGADLCEDLRGMCARPAAKVLSVSSWPSSSPSDCHVTDLPQAWPLPPRVWGEAEISEL